MQGLLLTAVIKWGVNDLSFEEAAATWSYVYTEIVESVPDAMTEAAREQNSGVHYQILVW